MKNLLIFTLLVLTASCSFVDEPIKTIDPELQPYYELFILEGIKRGKDFSGQDIILRFGDIGDAQGSEYYRLFDRVVEITIDRGQWEIGKNTATAFERTQNEMVVMHELGHGLLGRKHVEDCFSIMSTNQEFYCKYQNYEDHRELMLDELFKGI